MTDGIDRIAQIQLAMMQVTGPDKRGQHYKQIGILEADFEVLPDLAPELAVGLFAHAGVHRGHVRFSNGRQVDDREADIHGMAIKLHDVPTDTVLHDPASVGVQDFLLAEGPVFFIRTVEEYVLFIEDMAASEPRGEPPMKFIGWLKEHFPEDVAVFANLPKTVPDNVLQGTYFSQVPYRFGDDAVCRYRAIPAAGNPAGTIEPDSRSAGFLREQLVSDIETSGGSAEFDFEVQRNPDTSPEVIDNPTVQWDLPWQKVARVIIRAQEFSAQDEALGRDMGFTPWHAAPELEPVGEINAVRKAVYLASVQARHRAHST